MTMHEAGERRVRPAAVAGMFYPADSRVLRETVDGFLQAQEAAATAAPVRALVVPHAGYVYSGAAAAAGFAALKPQAARIHRVVMFGPAHRMWVEGMAIPSCDAFATPLGQVPVDAQAAAQMRDLPGVEVNDLAHLQEHCLEVELPFLQSVLPDFRVLPVVVGGASAAQVQAAMAAFCGQDDTLLLVSSDLSHYLDYRSAVALDTQTCTAVEQLRPDRIGETQACGRTPLRALLQLARDGGWQASTVALLNSGDTGGDHSRVVGYGCWVFTDENTH